MKGVIQFVRGREILDSRGTPTIEAELKTDKGLFRAAVPSGASRGKYEALELRDEEKRYQGRGVRKAVANIEKISQKIKGKLPEEQAVIDKIMIDSDGSDDKSELGANTVLAVSLATARAGAANKNISLYEHIRTLLPNLKGKPTLPRPCFNIVNGGLHAGNGLDVQEFMVVPNENSFKENLRAGQEIYQTLKEKLVEKFGPEAVNLGDEGGFAPPLKETRETLEMIIGAIKEAGYAERTMLGLDVAASQFFEKDKYLLENKKMGKGELIDFYQKLIKEYPILFIEDPFEENDWSSFSQLKKETGKDFLIIADDLTVTNPERIKKAHQEEACGGIIIKPNQIGTLTETMSAISLAKAFNWATIISHRSGETGDSFIADLAVAVSSQFIKSGAPARGERLAKYNQLLRIEESLS
jgi:enolase